MCSRKRLFIIFREKSPGKKLKQNRGRLQRAWKFNELIKPSFSDDKSTHSENVHLKNYKIRVENIKYVLEQDENETPIKWTTPKNEITELKRDFKEEIYLITYKPDEPTEKKFIKYYKSD